MAGQSGAVRAGRAYVELSGEDSKLSRVMAAATAKVKAFGQLTAKLGLAGAGGVAGVAGKAAGGILGSIFGAASYGAQIHDISKRFDVTAESVSELAGGFKVAGVSTQEFGGILDGLAGKISAAADSGSELIEGLTGLNGRVLIGKDVNTQLDMIAEKFKQIASAEDQVTRAGELGLSAILPQLKKGKAGLAELKAIGRDTGAMISTEDAARAKAAMVEWDKTVESARNTLMALGREFLPTTEQIQGLGKQAQQTFAQIREWIKEAADEVRNSKFGEAFDSIITAISRGDWQAAFKVATKGIEVIWAELVAKLTELWERFTIEMEQGLMVRAEKGVANVHAWWRIATTQDVREQDKAWQEMEAIKKVIDERAAKAAAVDAQNSPAVQGAKQRLQAARDELDQAIAAARGDKGAGGVGGAAGAAAGKGAEDAEIAADAMRRLRAHREDPGAHEKERQAFLDRMQEQEHLDEQQRVAKQRQQIEQNIKKRMADQGGGGVAVGYGAVKGTFALPAAGMQFGYGDQAKRSLEALIPIRQAVDKLPAAIDGAAQKLALQLAFK